MEEQLWKICESCTNTPVEGCESMTQEQVDVWMSENNESLETPNECGDTVKYIFLPVE
jgi:hypothetical protein